MDSDSVFDHHHSVLVSPIDEQTEVQFEQVTRLLIDTTPTMPAQNANTIFPWSVNMCSHEAYIWQSVRTMCLPLYSEFAELVNSKYVVYMDMLNRMLCMTPPPPQEIFDGAIQGSVFSFVIDRQRLALEVAAKCIQKQIYSIETERALLNIAKNRGCYPSHRDIHKLAHQLHLSPREIQLWFIRYRADHATTIPPPPHITPPHGCLVSFLNSNLIQHLPPTPPVPQHSEGGEEEEEKKEDRYKQQQQHA